MAYHYFFAIPGKCGEMRSADAERGRLSLSLPLPYPGAVCGFRFGSAPVGPDWVRFHCTAACFLPSSAEIDVAVQWQMWDVERYVKRQRESDEE